MGKPPAGRRSLGGALERKVYAILHRYPSLQGPDTPADPRQWPFPQLLDYLVREDASLRRVKRPLLETLAEKVSEAESTGEGPLDSDFEDLLHVKTMEVKDTNKMNKSLTSMWGTQPPTPGADDSPATPGAAAAESVTHDDARAPTVAAKPSKEMARPTVRFSDLGGVKPCIEEVLECVAMPITHPEIYAHIGVQPPRGILLHGPPGCGKTLLANAIAGELGVPFYQISAPSVVSGMSGESEKKIREVFEEAVAAAPCILFIDEIDAITPKRENAQREMERRIVAQLLTCMDDLSLEKTNNKAVMVIGATNRPDSLDPALRRAGRFDREISMNIPDEEAREQILRVLTAKLRLGGDFDYKDMARRTPGYVGADLNALTAAAGMYAVKRIFRDLSHRRDSKSDAELEEAEAEAESKESVERQLQTISAFLQQHPAPLTEGELAPLSITSEDFVHALAKVQPSSKREGFATVPDVSWSDIGALSYVRDELRMTVVEPIRHPEFFRKVGISRPAGVLLWGPPGCGKTLLAKAVANESHTNFISVKGPELLNKYVGESERAVRQVFSRARASSPCVVFFDELDALCSRRDDSQSEASARVVNTLLTELDGVDNRKQVFVIAASNRPDIIDAAMLRPGRLDKLLYVELPVAAERLEILRTLSRKTPLAADVSLQSVAEDARCEGFSGADLASLVREAGVAALRSTLYANGVDSSPLDMGATSAETLYVRQEHFDTAFTKVAPSVSAQDVKKYAALRKQYGCEKVTAAKRIDAGTA
ncbi:ribosome biogenesis ATPase RIX7 [Thamnocephalis sphaerospora]|uniref:Ribosome biogenesis ATPase RIX7 n=1 Tax=Thamnocephalis sphaerospora TaxID=78915 RepID=A0A4P9XV08_9FUNG|nr:ribosome biogenesis ATPase RIX7 [Thamnocephalis sphaerospora]|eukprot:RKP10066.1 ribosome biogenesis ATPase RIX7 [Thamnocephalis sphaerospora]